MRRRLGRDKLIGTGTIQIPSAVVHNRGLLAVQLLDNEGDLAGQVHPRRLCTVCECTSEKESVAYKVKGVPFLTRVATSAGDSPGRRAHMRASTIPCMAGLRLHLMCITVLG